MAHYKPAAPFNVAFVLLIPTKTTVQGVEKKTFPAVGEVGDDAKFNGSFRTFGGTERDVNGLYSIEDTATVETWYHPAITSECRIYVRQTGATYEIINEPENIELRNQYLKFMVKRIKGGA